MKKMALFLLAMLLVFTGCAPGEEFSGTTEIFGGDLGDIMVSIVLNKDSWEWAMVVPEGGRHPSPSELMELNKYVFDELLGERIHYGEVVVTDIGWSSGKIRRYMLTAGKSHSGWKGIKEIEETFQLPEGALQNLALDFLRSKGVKGLSGVLGAVAIITQAREMAYGAALLRLPRTPEGLLDLDQAQGMEWAILEKDAGQEFRLQGTEIVVPTREGMYTTPDGLRFQIRKQGCGPFFRKHVCFFVTFEARVAETN